MKIAILGARGFLGRKLSSQLVSLGHEVDGYVFNPDLEKNVEVKYKSIFDLLASPLPSKSTYDASINLAARRSTKAKQFTENEVNYFTFEIPQQFILRTAGPGTLVLNASTYIQNYLGEIGRTVDSYGAAKEKLSKFLERNSESNGFITRDLFLFTLFGLGDSPSHLVPLLLNAAKSGDEIALSPGHQLMNLLYVEDAVQNLLNCISFTDQSPYRKNFVWTEEYFSVRHLVNCIESVVGREINCAWGSREYAGHEMMHQWPIPMQQLPNFVAPTSIIDGITNIWEFD